MLKIIDSVDLKELEKFGWNYIDYKGYWSKGKFSVLKNRHIRSKAGDAYNGLDDLFDIIQAGLVEKVEE